MPNMKKLDDYFCFNEKLARQLVKIFGYDSEVGKALIKLDEKRKNNENYVISFNTTQWFITPRDLWDEDFYNH